ncbi:MAG TPA: hypothetical protein VMP01_23495 [Pirellulaceae bacterium]|nr:hypothetical protein [Pirellulaceae bacterium]
MPLVLTLKHTSSVPLDALGVLPAAVWGKSLADIEKLPVFAGNRQLPLAEFFSIGGDSGDETIVWEGALSGVHWIGAKMASGKLVIGGSVGRDHCALRQRRHSLRRGNEARLDRARSPAAGIGFQND